MNEEVASILIFILGFILGIIALILFNVLRIRKKEKIASDIVENAKKEADKIKRETILEAKEERCCQSQKSELLD